jgi:hypothetical protein
MKTWFPHLLLIAGSLVATAQTSGNSSGGFGPAYLPANPKAPQKKATTPDELNAHRARSKFQGLQSKDAELKPYDLAANSTFIQIGDQFTLVPKGALLHIPKKLASLIVSEPKGTFVAWPVMQEANRAKLARFEVTVDQASGKEAIDANKLALAKRSESILVATIENGAVSMAQPQPASAP